jgi:hypothetical protein
VGGDRGGVGRGGSEGRGGARGGLFGYLSTLFPWSFFSTRRGGVDESVEARGEGCVTGGEGGGGQGRRDRRKRKKIGRKISKVNFVIQKQY